MNHLKAYLQIEKLTKMGIDEKDNQVPNDEAFPAQKIKGHKICQRGSNNNTLFSRQIE